MEEVHHNHKETAWDWLGELMRFAPRPKRRARTASPVFTVTPWSSRSPAGWSA